jgi:hypothetical protein
MDIPVLTHRLPRLVLSLNYACVWGALTGPLQTDIAPVVEELINEQETKEESKY